MTKTEKNYWFKRRRYGYGWTPVTWQGWVTIVVFILTILSTAFIFDSMPYSNELLWIFLNTFITLVVLLVVISILKGPMPKWRWGKMPDDNPKEDY